MPRSERTQEAKILDFFRSTDLPIAGLVLGLCKDVVGERLKKSKEARERQLHRDPPPTEAHAAAVTLARVKVAKVKKAKTTKAKKHKGPRAMQAAAPRAETEPALPLETGGSADPLADQQDWEELAEPEYAGVDE